MSSRRLSRLAFVILLSGFSWSVARATETEPLFDWSDWEKYRGQVQHPSGAFKPADVARARENIQRYEWARSYAERLERTARVAVTQLTPAYLARMIPETTPGDPKFTPCPACRDQAKPVHPHGLWSWTASAPDQLTCDVCHTVFPNSRYPESITLRSTWGKPQEFSFYGGEPFVIFGLKTGRPSFTANVRARKVAHLASLARTLAEAYLLSGKSEYVQGVRAILLRFAAVYPHWLVHNGYGEYADLDPRVASQFILQLPALELCAPPTQPDRRLHTGYWTAGRAGGVGQESGFVRKVVEAYDFTCTATTTDGTPLYSDAERRTIERDLLLESTLLLVSDKQINNKSVGNRTAAALVGLCVGHPGLVRFGWDGFQRTVDGWFLPDGTTSESPAYAMMTLNNIWDMPQALRGYSEPESYRGPDGKRRVAVNLYRGTAYERIWENAFKGLQGNLTYPPFADSYLHSSLGSNFVELMVANYPERTEYLGLLQELCGPDLERGHAALAIYYREPGLEKKLAAPVVLPDWSPPDLRLGHLRTGADGRESLLLLSASHWGGHHHQDSLNLTYWKSGHEILSDLGYLWDHPRKHQTSRTLAHNTVLIDERDQLTKERGGEMTLFRTSKNVKVMTAASQAYAGSARYRRTAAIIDHGDGRNYVVDFFQVEGGQTQDFVYHASAATCEILGATPEPASERLYDLARVRTFDGARVWRTTWRAGANLMGVAWNIGQSGERAYVADGWGQRDWKNSDVGATLPYLIRRTHGAGPKFFVSVFEGHRPGEAWVRNVASPAPGVIAIETPLGTDFVMANADGGEFPVTGGDRTHRLRGRFAVVSMQDGKIVWDFQE